MSPSILYIHGFASCGSGNKVDVLRQHYGDNQVISPDLPVAPGKAIDFLADLIQQQDFKLLVGSSLGGYYAEYLNSKFRIPAVLINPSTRPFDTLQNYIGNNTNWCSGETFEWQQDYMQQLQHLYRDMPLQDEQYMVLLQTGDEVLDYRLAEQRYAAHELLIEQGGNHRFENLADYLQDIDRFISGTSA